MNAAALIVPRYLKSHGRPSSATIIVDGREQIETPVPSTDQMIAFVFDEFGLTISRWEADKVRTTLRALTETP